MQIPRPPPHRQTRDRRATVARGRSRYSFYPSLRKFIDDFDDFVSAARDLGMEVALTPHVHRSSRGSANTGKYLTEPPDGTIAYAENRRSTDDPLNLDNDPEGLYEVLRVVQHWVKFIM